MDELSEHEIKTDDFAKELIKEIATFFDKKGTRLIFEKGDGSSKSVIKIYIDAYKLLSEKVSEFHKKNPGTYVDRHRVFYDSLFSYISFCDEVPYHSVGGLMIASIASFTIMTELSSTLEMFLDDEEVPCVGSNKYFYKMLK